MADNNIFIRIRGEADLGDAQAQIRELTDRNKELEAQLKRVIKTEQEDAESIRQLGLAGEQLQAALKKNEEYYKRQKEAVEKVISANKQSVASLKQSVNQYNAVQGAGVRLRTQLMAIREEMVKLAEGGDTTSKRFTDLASRAAELTDTIGDTQQIINILASDTGKLDTALQVGGGLAGAFNAATSAAALLGGESEQLQQAFLKVQAALSVLNGLQQLNAVLDKRSAANVKIRLALAKLFNAEKTKEAVTTTASTAATSAHSAAMRADAVATTTATVATKGFTKALLGNPVMIIVAALSALVWGVSKYIDKVKEAKKETRDFSRELDNLKAYNDRVKEEYEFQAQLAEAEGKSWREVHEIRAKGVQEQIDYTNKEIRNQERIKNERKLWNKEWSKDEEEHLNTLKKQEEQYRKDLEALNKAYRIAEANEAREARDKREREEKEAAERRLQMAMQQAKDAATVQQVLRNINDTQGSYDENDVYWTNQEKALIGLADAAKQADDALKGLNEREEEVNLASYESFLDMKLAGMQLEGATDQEMWDYKYQNMMRYLEAKKKSLENQLGSEAEFSQEMVDINTQMTDLEIENNKRVQQSAQEKLAETINIATEALGTLSDIMSEVFGAISDHIQTQMDDLNEMYTTDAEEAREDANKKYISEKELSNKQLALKRKQAAVDKASALFSIGLNTAIAIMRIWADVPKGDFAATTIALTALVSALGATQLAVAAAKPLPKYEKGRKGGKGEYALVGEKGPELMYVPAGASIVPNNKMGNMNAWGDYGVPRLNIPASATMNSEMLSTAMMMQGVHFDYDRLGKAVAQNMPQQKAVSVNVDRNGVTINSDGNSRTYMNQKYSAAW